MGSRTQSKSDSGVNEMERERAKREIDTDGKKMHIKGFTNPQRRAYFSAKTPHTAIGSRCGLYHQPPQPHPLVQGIARLPLPGNPFAVSTPTPHDRVTRAVVFPTVSSSVAVGMVAPRRLGEGEVTANVCDMMSGSASCPLCTD
ncbi:hypothetical protein EYF80_033397 [Liparis tanakae]|uniref:Uncharacterized protein n=1 Tax=Liparis tanakae TaxID=230148 RepID=A0A4Z2GSS2_9TELE|nr:hypothetical protein EYF80_033397 [Liparis tanakae]